ncbi:hypothetical protein FZ041_04455 [Selenomonas caprae]|uniref:Uncharacterized protein n=1 Tax=Selenomonas caprae TaxID=2606905 RepID=A0A5D6WR97_9FIRM|nr:hypothetical protein FZ041_04455 [Selenomonas caprae]
MGREKIRTEVQFIPAKVKVVDYYRESFPCLECRKNKTKNLTCGYTPTANMSRKGIKYGFMSTNLAVAAAGTSTARKRQAGGLFCVAGRNPNELQINFEDNR